ncbi:hypothetical protein ACI8AG_10880 [Blastococcus sp. SYSU DS0552]
MRSCVSGTGTGPKATVGLDSGTGPLDLVDQYGSPRWSAGGAGWGQTFADAAPGPVERMRDPMTAIRGLLDFELGPVVSVTGGTLLRPVRAGRPLPHDDADLAYLSRDEFPGPWTERAGDAPREIHPSCWRGCGRTP